MYFHQIPLCFGRGGGGGGGGGGGAYSLCFGV